MILFILSSNNDDLDIITFVTHLRIESTAARYHSPTTNNTRETSEKELENFCICGVVVCRPRSFENIIYPSVEEESQRRSGASKL